MKKLISIILDNTTKVNVDSDLSDVNMVFFGVSITKSHISKEHLLQEIYELSDSIDFVSGKEVSYLEAGAWLGDQELALRLFALMSHVELCKLLTPYSVLGNLVPNETALRLAGQGMITVLPLTARKGETLEKTGKNEVAENIKQYGWQLFHIFNNHDSDEKFIPFFYTVGLTEIDLPEIVLVGGMNPKNAHSIIHTIIENWKKNGFKECISSDFISDRDGNDMLLEFVELEPTGEVKDDIAIQLFRYYEGSKFTPRVAQVIWADQDNNLPSSGKFNMGEFTKILTPKVKTETSSFSA